MDRAYAARVLAENVSGHVCRLANKPDVTPLRAGGKPLRVRTIMTPEWRDPGYVDLQPGQRAGAPSRGARGAGYPRLTRHRSSGLVAPR